MFNFYLQNKSYENANAQAIECNLQDLNDLVIVDRKQDDSFLKHDSIWATNTLDGVFSDVVFSKLEDKQLSNIVLPKMFHAIDSIDFEINSFEDFDKVHKGYNAFYGIHFDNVNQARCIIDKISHSHFRQNNLWEVTPASFWERKERLFSNLIFCPSVEDDIKLIGGTYLSQIIVKLKELDRYIANYWKAGNFNFGDVNSRAALNISPESKKTMDQKKYRDQRIFSLPDGRKECFELHIKTGNLRFHFFPENGMIYIGYIGKHLDTDKFN